MAFKEPHFNKAGAKAFTEAWGQTNADMVKKSSTAKRSTGGKSKGTSGKKSK